MKKLLYILLLGGFTSSMHSCTKFLERIPENFQLTDTAIKDAASLQALLNGAYNDHAFNVHSGKIQWIQDLLGDHAIGTLFTGDDSEIFNRRTSIFGDYKNGMYTQMYKIVFSANLVLQYIDRAETSRDDIEGQARFLRALLHFQVLNLWAQPWGYTSDNSHDGIVIADIAAISVKHRSTVAQVYSFIENDLLLAIDKLNASGPVHKANKNSAKALLAKVYFMQQRYADAFTYASEVIGSGDYEMDATYEVKYSVGGSQEIIFGYPTVLQSFEPGGEFRGRYRTDINFSPQGQFYISNALFNAANMNGDRRGQAWFSNTLRAGYNVLTKFNSDYFDVPVIGLTEIKLIRAEAGALAGTSTLATAITDINDIMTRAYGSTAFNLAPNTPAATVVNAVRRERQIEMIGEGDRLYEIKRIGALTGNNIDARGAAWNCPGLILQFPQGEKASNTSFVMNVEGGCN